MSEAMTCAHCLHEFIPWNVDTVPPDQPDHPCPFGVDVLAGLPPIVDLFGREIRSHRFGNCPACFGPLEVINGESARSAFVPVPTPIGGWR